MNVRPCRSVRIHVMHKCNLLYWFTDRNQSLQKWFLDTLWIHTYLKTLFFSLCLKYLDASGNPHLHL